MREAKDSPGTYFPVLGAPALFDGPGEVRALCRAFDWSSTPLGPVTGWPPSLRTTVRTLLASRHPMFLWWGPELTQIYNDAFSPSLGEGGRQPRALGMRGDEYWAEVWDVAGPQIAQVLAGGDATWHEDQLISFERNGRVEDIYWTYSYSPAYDDAGRVAGVLVVCQETTQRILDERERTQLLVALEVERARLAYVFQQAPSFLAVLRGPAYVFTLVNDAYYQLVGHRELVGRPLWEALPEVRGQGFEERLDRVIATGEPFLGREVPLSVARTPGAAPEDRFIDLTYMPLVEPDGTRAGIIAHGADVTEQVWARQKLERANQQLQEQTLQLEARSREAELARAEAEHANQVKSNFLAAMSHELRTPLNAIAGHAQLIELGIHGPVTDAQRTALARIQMAEGHLLALVEDVLHFAQVEAGHVEYTLAAWSLADVIADVAPMIETQLKAKDLGYTMRIAPDLMVRADREKLQQVLVNLLANAIKFTDAGGQICVDTGRREVPSLDEATPTADGVVFLRVSDTGVGILREKQEDIFSPFVQIRSLTTSAGGTGLGLTISRDLARGMGGDLRVRSTLGVGSTFTLTLPEG